MAAWYLVNGTANAGVVAGLDGLLPPSQAQRVQNAQMLLTHAGTALAECDKEVVNRGGHGYTQE